MDSSPDIIGRALMGAFNPTPKREQVYNEYFKELRDKYIYKYNLLKALVRGIDSVDVNLKEDISSKVKTVIGKEANDILKGLPYVDFPTNLEVESGFFALLDFTKVKGMKYKDDVINTERDLLKFFYQTCRIRFLVGQSISWPYEDELIGRVTTTLEDKQMIEAFASMNKALRLLKVKDDYIIRKNELCDQEQMAHIKVDGWKNTYDKIIASRYLKTLNYEQQTKRYIASFEEYKDLVLVAVKGEEVLGYSCFDLTDKSGNFDSELVSLYIKPSKKGQGIGTNLLKETAKELLSKGKKNMIIWCLKENKSAIKFYEKLGGKRVLEKDAQIGKDIYKEYGFYFDLEQVLK